MRLSFGEVLIISFLIFLLFGNFSKIKVFLINFFIKLRSNNIFK